MIITFLSNTISRNGGGVTEIERRLAQQLAQQREHTVHVLGLEDAFSKEDIKDWLPVQPTVFPVTGPRAFGYAPEMLRHVQEINPDVLHINSLWMYPSVVTKQWHDATHKPFVVTVNGMLDAWALNNSRWKKVMAAFLYEKENLKKASCIIANSLKELQAIRDYGLTNPVAIIPNGVDLPVIKEGNKPANGNKKLLYLGRIHPKKGSEELIKAWKAVNRQQDTGWELEIVGWGDEKDIAQLQEQISHMDTIHYLGPKFGQEKDAAFRQADAFILPSYSEGMPMAVLEAWSYQLPVLITPACNLDIGYQREAAIHIEVDSLEESLRSLFAMENPQLEQIGHHGRKLVEENFSWVKAAEQLEQVYQWITGKKPKPDFVHQ